MRRLSVCILGGTGFVGTRLVARLIKEGHRVTVLSRDREQHKHLRVLPGLELENCDVYDPAALSERFRGQDVVVNLIGILNEPIFGGGGFKRTHTDLTRGALQAAKSAGVTRFLQMSSLRAATDAPSNYLRSKGDAERIIQADSGAVDWTIFKPSVMFGPGDSFLNRFAGMLAAMPLGFPLTKPNAVMQPVFVDDVVEAIVRCLGGRVGTRKIFELGGPQRYTLREIVALVATITGRRRRIVGLPDLISRPLAFAMDFVPGRPFSSDNYRSLSVMSVCTDDGFARLGIKPRSMVGIARQYLGAYEDNARLSRDRAAIGRVVP